ncbi:MAG: RNA polymerase sigma factor [Xanthomonadales bacterium]|nr:RNA polymerase sigma factor [Xanthomonadales bacterium]MCE7931028.1 RNA polymerase sigma factor [Xanthomonadales bacterium PRO6]
MTRHDDTTIALRGRLDHFLRTVERRALRMARLAVGDLDDALELVQDSMLGFVRSYATRPEVEWPPLYWRVLDSRIQDHHRRQSVRRRWRVFFRSEGEGEENVDALAAVADPVAPGPLDRSTGDEAARAIDAALRALPDRQRQAFLLRVWEGFDVAGTAAVMGCSEGSVKTHLFRAMDALRKRLEDHR